MADLTDEEVSHWIRVVSDKAMIAANGGDMDALRVCVFAHGYKCSDPACVVAFSPPAA